MKRSSTIWIIVIVVIVVIAGIWYWSSSMGTQNASNTGANATTSATAGTGTNNAGGGTSATSGSGSTSANSVVILNSESTTTLGTYLAATNGMTLYLYTKDTAHVSNCTGTCATTWPPYTITATQAKSLLGSTAGITGAIGTITRANGSIQVTYNNLPLYLYSGDQIVGDAKGQNLDGFVIVNL